MVVVATLWTAVAWLRARRPDVGVAISRSRIAAAAALGAVALTASMVVLAPSTDHPEEYLGETLGELVDPTAAALDPERTYVVEWKDAYFFGSQAFGLVNELRRAGFVVGAGEFWTVPITSSRTIPTGAADAALVFVTGGFVEDWRADDRFVEVATVDPRSAAELADFDRLRAELIADLEATGLDDLVPLVDTNLFGLNIDQRISDTTRSLSAQMIRLGQETAVFLGPPGTAVPGVDEVQPAATEAAGDDASSETTIEASGDPEPPRPTFEGSSGLRCYTDEAMSNTYDYAVDATPMVSVRAAVDGWWLSEAPLYLDRRVLTESGPVPIADTDRTEVTFSDAAGNPQAVLWLRAHGDGWLVESDFLCLTATLDESR